MFVVNNIDSQLLDIYHSKRDNNWVNEILQECRLKENSLEKFIEACIYIMQKQVFSKNFLDELQQLIHSIKPKIFAIRTGGSEIERIKKPGDYYKQFLDDYDNLLNFCVKYRIVALISISGCIKDYYDIEKKKRDKKLTEFKN